MLESIPYQGIFKRNFSVTKLHCDTFSLLQHGSKQVYLVGNNSSENDLKNIMDVIEQIKPESTYFQIDDDRATCIRKLFKDVYMYIYFGNFR